MRYTSTAFLILALLAFTNSGNAQTWPWAKRIGGTAPMNALNTFGLNPYQTLRDITGDNAGNIYVLSFVYDSLLNINGLALSGKGKGNSLISSFNCGGTHRWSKVLGSANDSELTYAIRTDYIGNVYAFGKIALTQGGDFGSDTVLAATNKTLFLAKWDSAGRFQWLRMPEPDAVDHVTSIRENSPIDMDIDHEGNIHLLSYLSPGIYGGTYTVNNAGATVLKYNGGGQLLTGLPLGIQLLGTGNIIEFFLGNYGFTYSSGTGRYLIAGTPGRPNTAQPGASFVQVGTQVIGASKGFFAAFNSGTGAVISLITRLSGTPASDRGIALRSRPVTDALNNIYLAGYAVDSATFNGFMFRNPKSRLAPIPFVMKMDGLNGSVRWVQYGHSTGAYSNSQWALNQLSLINGKVLMAGQFTDSLVFPSAVLSKASVSDSVRGFVLQVDAVTGRMQNAVAFGGGNRSALELPTAVGADKRGNFYIGGRYSTPSVTFGGITLPNASAPRIYSDAFLAKWGIASCNCSVPAPSFSTGTPSGNARRYTYTGTTTGIDSLVWSWGDGQMQKVTTGFTSQVSHTYASKDSTYEVCVTAYSSTCGSNQTCIKSVPLSIAALTLNGISVYPNPTTGTLTIEGAMGAALSIHSVIGNMVLSQSVRSNRDQVNIAAWPAGVYLLTITNAAGEKATMPIVKR